MLTQFIRVLRGTASGSPETVALEDLSMDNAESNSMLFNQKYLYIAQKFPFNNFFLLLGTVVNATAGKVMKVEYWNAAEEWVEAKDILDFTKGLMKHGLVQFSLDNQFSWDRITETDDDDTQMPDELEDLNINDCYWIRISFDTAPDVTTEINKVCYAFTTTAIINGVDKKAPNYYETFQTGKTSWLDEILTASEIMVSEMKTAGIIKSAGQIILLDDFYLPCAYRVLCHIYEQMGPAYDERRKEKLGQYQSFLKGPKTLDENQDAKIELRENQASSSRAFR